MNTLSLPANVKRLLRCCALLLTAMISATALAEPAGDLPVQISADRGQFDQQEGVGVYEGNVELLQGNRRVTADRIELFTRNGELNRVEATGQPVTMREGDDLETRADKLVYDLNARTVVMIGNAFMRRDGSTFEGARVEYHMDNRRVDASSEGDQRVRLVIPPEGIQRRPGNEDNQ